MERVEDIQAGRLVVIGAGKESAAMARAVEAHWHTGNTLQARPSLTRSV